jgi:hypothetical protein
MTMSVTSAPSAIATARAFQHCHALNHGTEFHGFTTGGICASFR